MTGGRIKRVRDYIGDEPFCLTYGDGVSDVDITDLIAFHRAQGTLATVTAVQQPGRFGALDLSPDATRVNGFREKSVSDGHLINGGFFVCEPQVIDYHRGDETVWEHEPLQPSSPQGQLAVYHHKASGRTWTRCATSTCCRRLWEAARRRWKIWDRAGRAAPPRPGARAPSG